ncbi:MAG: toxin-antitoxin system HicB family antitoxin [Pirellulaceae bacterium]
MTDQSPSATLEQRRREAHRQASALYGQHPDWVTFFREILGMGGVVRRLFPTREAIAEFEKSTEYAEVQLMLARLRHRSNSRGEGHEPIRVITVRLPQSLHEALQAEAYAHETSMNKLCITKLLRVIEGQSPEAIREQPNSLSEQPTGEQATGEQATTGEQPTDERATGEQAAS